MLRPVRAAASGLAMALLLPLAHATVTSEDETTGEAAPFTLLGSRAVEAETLSAQRGGTEVFNDMRLRGVVADNQIVDVTTGSNFISDGAFTGSSGMPMVIQNSGNSVLIQNATIVNVQVN